MSRVVILDPLWPLDRTAGALDGLEIGLEVADRAAGEDVVAVLVAPEQTIGADLLDACPHLRMAGTCSTGYDNLDVDALTAAGVRCVHVGGYCDEEVADHTIALAMALLRAVPQLDAHVREGGWWPFPRAPRRIAGSLLGVIGFGRIGRLVAARGLAVGLRVCATDAHVDPAAIAAAGVEPVALDALLATSDVVTLHAPLLPETQHLIDAAALARMRDDAYLVNCARAGLVDHAALGAALRDGVIAGAALDVFPVEPPPADEPARTWPNAVLQPHAAWYSPEAHFAPYTRLIEDVARLLRGDEPIGLIRRPEAPR